jgi:DNA-binding GntR family transcriptional regulator
MIGIGGRVYKTPGAKLLVDRVYEALKQDAVEGRLLPGQILVEGEVADRFGMSKGPVREALKHLAIAGFVDSLPRVGYVVQGIKISDIDDIFALRIAIEPMAVQLAIGRMSSVDLDHLDGLAAADPAARDAPADRRGHALAIANYGFHMEIARLSGNRRLERILAGLLEELERVIHLLALNLDAVADDHPDLVAVMRSGNAQQAATMMREQLISNREAMRVAAVRTTFTSQLELDVIRSLGDASHGFAERGGAVTNGPEAAQAGPGATRRQQA